jgi:hypothetical protein
MGGGWSLEIYASSRKFFGDLVKSVPSATGERYGRALLAYECSLTRLESALRSWLTCEYWPVVILPIFLRISPLKLDFLYHPRICT